MAMAMQAAKTKSPPSAGFPDTPRNSETITVSCSRALDTDQREMAKAEEVTSYPESIY
jgi:hypothetical protein